MGVYLVGVDIFNLLNTFEPKFNGQSQERSKYARNWVVNLFYVLKKQNKQ